MTTIQITVDGVAMVHLLGPQDKLLRMVEKEHPEVDVHVRGNEITLTGDAEQVAAAKTLVDELVTMTREGIAAAPEDVEVSSRALRNGSAPAEAILTTRGKVIRPKTDGQRDYVDAIDENTIVFGIGPAGTGKT
jgi:phosphate starvation-inducible PhoH-like protein